MKTTSFADVMLASALTLLPACVFPPSQAVPPQVHVIDATPRLPLSTPAAVHGVNEVMTGSYQPVAILYAADFGFSGTASSAALFAATAASLGADTVIGFRAQAWALYPLGLAARRIADSGPLTLVDCRPMVVETETIHWIGDQPWGESRTLKPDGIGSTCFSQIALALASRGYLACHKHQMPGLKPDYVLRVTVLENHLFFFLLGSQRKYSVRVELVSQQTGAVEQSVRGTGKATNAMKWPATDPAPAAMAKAASNAIAQLKESCSELEQSSQSKRSGKTAGLPVRDDLL